MLLPASLFSKISMKLELFPNYLMNVYIITMNSHCIRAYSRGTEFEMKKPKAGK